MRRSLVLLVLLVLVAAVPFASAAKRGKGHAQQESIVVVPDVVACTDFSRTPCHAIVTAPSVCIAGFSNGTFISADLPSISYGFIVPGVPCDTSTFMIDVAAGTYDVPSMVCDYVPGSRPTNCRVGPSATLTVQ